MNYATFYTTSNRVVIIIIIIIIINLLGSHWLLGVSVLEVKDSDWVASQGPSVVEQTEVGGPDLFVFFNISWFSGSESCCLVTDRSRLVTVRLSILG